MAKKSKKYTEALNQIEKSKLYTNIVKMIRPKQNYINRDVLTVDAIVTDGKNNLQCYLDLVSEDGLAHAVLRYKKKKYTFDDMYKEYDKCLERGMILIAAPHPEAFDYFDSRNIKFCFVYPDKNAREKLKKRFESRNNSESFIKENDDLFDEFYISNRQDKRAVVHDEFSGDEYLSDILKKFGLDF